MVLFMLITRKLLPQALSYFTLASQQGHTEAELQLGLMHLSGIGVKKDHGIALKHFNVASKSGYPHFFRRVTLILHWGYIIDCCLELIG